MLTVLTYLLPPVCGGIIGYVTNDIAIRMLFRPHKAKYVCGYKVPFTPGIIAKEKGRIARAMGDAISANLMNQEVLAKTLLSDELCQKMEKAIDEFCNTQRHNPETIHEFLSKYVPSEDIENFVHEATSDMEASITSKLVNSDLGNEIAHMAVEHATERMGGGLLGLFGADKILGKIAQAAEPMLAGEIDSMLQKNASGLVHKMVGNQSEELLNTKMKDLFGSHEEQVLQIRNSIMRSYRTIVQEQLPKMLQALDISRIVEERINEMDMAEIEPVILNVMDKELKALVWFGAGLGALIGCVNIFI